MRKIYGKFALALSMVMAAGIMGCVISPPPVDGQGRPLIKKLGTIDLDLVECTPVVFHGKVYRFEWVRKSYLGHSLDQSWAQDGYFRLVEHGTEKVTPPFAQGYAFGSAFVDGDMVYVTGTSTEKGWSGQRVQIFASRDLQSWEEWTALDLDRFGICNTSICKAEDQYVLMFEIYEPKEQAGVPFTARFAFSKDLKNWEVTPPECVYAKDRYSAPHCLRYLDGYFYDFYLEAHEGYEMRVVRSRDLINWEASPLNPVLKASEQDKIIFNPKLTAEQRAKVAQAEDINNSDIDFCEYQGKLIINYSWGNQQGQEFLGEAVYAGTQEQFLKGWYPEPAAGGMKGLTIVYPEGGSYAEVLAARELRRYWYLRSGQMAGLEASEGKLPGKGDLIVVGQKSRELFQAVLDQNAELKTQFSSLESQNYILKTLEGKRRILVIAGGDETGTLYGAYRLVERLGVRFSLEGDVIPDEKILPEVPVVEECGKPLFALRGILPFHDFPEGPDWWTTDDYKAILSQLPKLRMNFIGLHTYPEGGGWGPEPTTWIGVKEDVGENGQVKFSYPSRYHSTRRGNSAWGYPAKNTGDYSFGAADLFERDDFGADVMRDMIPEPQTPEQCNELFNRTGAMFREAFTFARPLGVKTCIGTETPLTIPALVKERLEKAGKNPADPAVAAEVYEGMFERIARTHPLDYYWLWTNEGWTWSGVPDEAVEAVEQDLLTAVKAAERVKAPFTLATCGWVLGPPKDRARFDQILPKEMPFSCINREVGKAPVEKQFAKITGRPLWAIPWLEDDPGMISPQLWAGRMRKDAADALEYGCTGLMGIHWRTRILGPNVLALAWAAWDQSPWKQTAGQSATSEEPVVLIGGKEAAYLNSPIEGTEDDPLYQTVCWNLTSYQFLVPKGTYQVKLQFSEVAYDENGKRVFDVKLQDTIVLEDLDIHARVGKNQALDFVFDAVQADSGRLVIEFIPKVEFPCISAISVEGMGVSRKINCSGPAYQDYQADVQPKETERFMPVDDFYLDWARQQFGAVAAEPVAKIFSRIDGHLPEPATWIDGPGGIIPNPQPWAEVEKQYGFVAELEHLEALVIGAASREQFGYWLNTLRYMKAMARTGCTAGQLNQVMEQIQGQADPAAKQTAARQQALPLRLEMVQDWAAMMGYLLATVTNASELGTIMNVEARSMPVLMYRHDAVLEELLGEPLPAAAKPGRDYQGPTRIIVPTRRTCLATGEDLVLKVMVLSQVLPKSATLHWRRLGEEPWQTVPLVHEARGVYRVTLSGNDIQDRDFEYYLSAETEDGNKVCYPATAPQINQTVVVMSLKQG